MWASTTCKQGGGWVGTLAYGAFMSNEGNLKPHKSTRAPFTVNDRLFTVIKVTLYDKCVMLILPPLYYILRIN